MDLYFEIAGNQIDGARDYQEDAFMVTHLGEGDERSAASLLIVADGMGGHAAGNVASNMAISTFNKTFSGAYPTDDVSGALNKSLLAANDAIGAAVKETPGLRGMGCTMVAAFVSKGRIWWASVGDSHLYLLRDRELVKKNADHSYGGFLKRMREQGVDVAPDPNLSPNMLMSAMIGDEIAEIDLPEEPLDLRSGDRVLLASDGLDTLGQGAIIQYSAWSKTPRECVTALLEAVEAANQPRQDNTTVIVIDVKERAARPAAAEPAPPAQEESAVEEVEAAPAPEPEPEDNTEPQYAEQTQPQAEAEEIEQERAGGGKGMLIGIAALVLLAAAGGAYFLLGGKQEPPAPEPVREPEPAVAEKPEPAREPEPAVVEKPEPVAEPEPEPEPEKIIQDSLASGASGPEMVRIPGGSFEMGGRASSLSPDELPTHQVKFDPFFMSRHEVTFAQYDRFAKATDRPLPPSGDLDREDHPVVNVSWDQAYAYANWLSAQTGETYRLPTEAEWEYAASAGSKTQYWWGQKVGKGNAHCFDCKSGLHPRKPARVGFFEANPFGLYDTAGNVWEWVHDCYHDSYKGAPRDGSVWQGGDCTRRVARGGSFASPSSSLRSAKRESFVSNNGYDDVGIRLVREP